MKWEECFTDICSSLFKITLTYKGKTVWGTGFAVARYKNPDKLGLVLATAKHVIAFSENDLVEWKIEQFNWIGDLKHTQTFKSNNAVTKSSPIRVHTQFDIGNVFIHKFSDNIQDSIVRTINIQNAAPPGTRVGWAGFPALMEGKRPCYFEGVISSLFHQVERLYYIVDGHIGHGVSGGPLWCWNDDINGYEVIGIVSEYKYPKVNLPGLCVFESINPLIAYLSASEELELDISVPQKLGRLNEIL